MKFVARNLQDGGSLDLILNLGRIPVNMIGKITIAVSPLCIVCVCVCCVCDACCYDAPCIYYCCHTRIELLVVSLVVVVV